jgi:hypothetical protein
MHSIGYQKDIGPTLKELWCRGHQQWKIETDNKRKRDDEKKQHANPKAKR